ncbi:NADH-quinone oxidoreductase subunit E [Candidatus Johnevansia muelleri]|uniref:NADH-quinone oxidoreductase subunit E n=1 Tax=Candidatus Johnevansia muelleri TaxID=1495769 RepID=A0A078KBL0_9GAMM|nr:NADH-quinone oxidoreductase subunit E [Candidatus Evansia muelleri]
MDNKNYLYNNVKSKERDEIISIIKNYEHPRAAIIEALKIVQKYRGWVPDNLIFFIAKLLNITTIDVEEVATFYSHIFRQKVGRNIILICDSITCYINGYKEIYNKLKLELKIVFGQTSPDKRFTLLPVCCLGNCDKSPTMMINKDTYNNINIKNIMNIIEMYK